MNFKAVQCLSIKNSKTIQLYNLKKLVEIFVWCQICNAIMSCFVYEQTTGDIPSSADRNTWRADGNQRMYFAVNIPEPTNGHEETVVKSATLKLFKKAVYPDRLLADNIVAKSIRIDVYQLTDVKVRKIAYL